MTNQIRKLLRGVQFFPQFKPPLLIQIHTVFKLSNMNILDD